MTLRTATTFNFEQLDLLYPCKGNGHISDWNVSAVLTNMFGAFGNRHTFNEDLSDWNRLPRLHGDGVDVFLQFCFQSRSQSNWDISSLVNMGHMFRGAHVI